MENKNIKFAFFGTPHVASETLLVLINNGYIPSIIITSPDKKSGRGMQLNPTKVSILAHEYNIPCLKIEKIDQEFIDEFKNFKIDLSIVVAYGKILPEELINSPKFGTINIHYSLLPKYRGASPLEQALLLGDKKTGISIQQMVFKLDSGPIITKKEILIDINEDKETLRNKLVKLGANTLIEILPKIITQEINPEIQDESNSSYCKKIKKEDGQIDIINGNDLENYNKYRAYSGWPGVYFFAIKNGKNIRIKITKAIYENNSFIIKRVIPEGKKEVNYSDFLNSNISL